MSTPTVTFREYQKQDAPALEKIIREVWDYEQFCAPKIAKKMAVLYLRSCLSEQNFTQVALRDGQPVGIIMAKSNKQFRRSARYTFSQLAAVCRLVLTKDGRQVCTFFSEINSQYKSLLTESGGNFDGELVFFVVDASAQGLGIGKQLFACANDFFKERNVKKFYLYTDSTCNYAFYESRGMRRAVEKVRSMRPYLDDEMKFYLYCS